MSSTALDTIGGRRRRSPAPCGPSTSSTTAACPGVCTSATSPSRGSHSSRPGTRKEPSGSSATATAQLFVASSWLVPSGLDRHCFGGYGPGELHGDPPQSLGALRLWERRQPVPGRRASVALAACIDRKRSKRARPPERGRRFTRRGARERGGVLRGSGCGTAQTDGSRTHWRRTPAPPRRSGAARGPHIAGPHGSDARCST